MASAAQTKATTKYIKEHTTRFVLQCNNVKDADIISFLKEQKNVNAVLKNLVREKIEKEA